MDEAPFRLIATARADVVGPLLPRFRSAGLRGVISDTNRIGARVEVPGSAAQAGMTWKDSDRSTGRWWPQGITTSADANGHAETAGTFEGHDVVLVSWYAHGPLGWALLGSRISVVVEVDSATPSYRHVWLVEPRRWLGLTSLRPVRVHAGGIVWYGEHLYVTGGDGGIRVFRLDDIARVRNRVRTRGYRYVLPQVMAYEAQADSTGRPMRYSFLSLHRGDDVDHLVAGEYGRKGGSHRLVRYALDRETELLTSDEHGRSVPAEMYDRQVDRMQGATLVDETWVVTASAGENNPGDLWVGRPGEFVRHRGVLPTGPEDITYWPQRGELWSVTEWPGRRWVYGIDAARWIGRDDTSA